MKRRCCSICGLPGHDARTRHKRRNPAKKKGAKQGGFWSDGEDLPLFSGTPQRASDGRFKPASKARQGSFPGTGVDWEHVRKQQKKRKRNPFAPGKPIRYELKESGTRADTYVIDATQGHYRQHAGTVEGWRRVRGALLSAGVKPDEVWGFGQIRQKEQRFARAGSRAAGRKAGQVTKEMQLIAAAIREYERDLAKIEKQTAGLKGEGSRKKKAELKELADWTRKEIAREQDKYDRHRKAWIALENRSRTIVGKAPALRGSGSAEARRISATEERRRAGNLRRRSGRGMSQRERDEFARHVRGR